MKKKYMTPDMEVIELNLASSMLASMSLDVKEDDDTEWDTTGGQGSREDRPSNPNLWDSVW